MRVEVLISCMFQSAREIIGNTNIQSDVVVVNQCDENSREEFVFLNKIGEECKAVVINSTERGLSKSRNLAIKNASGDYCLICDDDETLVDDYVQIIKKSVEYHPDVSVFAYKFKLSENYYMKKVFWTEERVIDYKTALKISSWQILFKREEIIKKGIWFDEEIGSGITKAGGEEKIFQHDCLKCNLKIMYQPYVIGSIKYEASQWTQNLFTKPYFVDWGYYFRRLKWGKLGATIMCGMFAIKKREEYKHKLSLFSATKAMLKGIWIK